MAILIGCFTRTFFLWESKILYCLAKAKDTQWASFEFDYKKEFMLKVYIQIHQTLKTSWKGYYFFLFNAAMIVNV